MYGKPWPCNDNIAQNGRFPLIYHFIPLTNPVEPHFGQLADLVPLGVFQQIAVICISGKVFQWVKGLLSRVYVEDDLVKAKFIAIGILKARFGIITQVFNVEEYPDKINIIIA